MDAVSTVALPMFALVLSGYAANRLGLLAAASTAGLNGFVYWFALPALLFVKVADAAILERFDWRLLAAYHAAGLTVFGLAMLSGRLVFGRPLAALGLDGLAAAFPNVGYMGLPLLLTAFGPPAVLPSVLILVSDALVTVPLCVAVVEAGLGGGGRMLTVARAVGRGLGRNPLVLATAAGALASVSGVAVPVPVKALGNFLGSAALPCALFALGGSLLGRLVPTAPGVVGLLVTLKLLAHPALMWLAAARLFALDPVWVKVAVIDAALPTAATVFVLAERYDVEVESASSVILLGTLGAVVTVTTLLAWLAPG